MKLPFGKKPSPKRNGLLPDQVLEFLDKADKAYMESYKTQSVRSFRDYAARDCEVKIAQSVRSGVPRYFGSEKHRTTTWTLISQTASRLLVKKEVVFHNVRVGGSLSIHIAEDYNELWEIEIGDEQTYQVKQISKMKL
jgi:hypothetical protein